MQFEFLSLLNSSFFQCHESARVGFRSFVCTHFVTRDIKFLHSNHKFYNENNSRKLQNVFFLRPFLCVRSPSKWLCDIFFTTKRKFSSFIRLLLCIILYDFPRIENEACMQIGPTYVFSLSSFPALLYF